MTPLPATASGVLAVIYRFTVGGDQNVTTKLHFRYTGGPPTQANMAALAGSIQADFITNVKPWLINNLSLNQLTVLDLANPTTPPGINTTPVPGSRTGGNNPANVALVVGYKIARRYRGGHPRGYWPLLGSGDLSSPGAWNATTLGNVQSALVAHIAAIKAMTSGGVTIGNQCNVSYYSGGSWTTPTGGSKPKWRPTLRTPPAVDDIISVTANVKPGSQRRRMKKA